MISFISGALIGIGFLELIFSTDFSDDRLFREFECSFRQTNFSGNLQLSIWSFIENPIRNVSLEQLRSMTNTCKFEIYVKRFEELRTWHKNDTKLVPEALITLIKKTIDEIENEETGSRLKTIERTVAETGIWFALELLKRGILTDKGTFSNNFFGVSTFAAIFRYIPFFCVSNCSRLRLSLNRFYGIFGNFPFNRLFR